MSSTPLANDGDLLDEAFDDDLCESTRILISDSMRIMGTGKLRFKKDVKIATTERSKKTRRQREQGGNGNESILSTTSSTVKVDGFVDEDGKEEEKEVTETHQV